MRSGSGTTLVRNWRDTKQKTESKSGGATKGNGKGYLTGHK